MIVFIIFCKIILTELEKLTINHTLHRMRIRWLSGYEILAAIHCRLLQLFARQQSMLAASTDERDINFFTKMTVAACNRW